MTLERRPCDMYDSGRRTDRPTQTWGQHLKERLGALWFLLMIKRVFVEGEATTVPSITAAVPRRRRGKCGSEIGQKRISQIPLNPEKNSSGNRPSWVLVGLCVGLGGI
ncbi:unnamed protein product [Calypogeia fissa]